MALRILLVDDNPDDRRLVRREISKVLPEAVVDEVGDPAGFEALLTQAPGWDVVVTDYQLRWSTGMDVFRRLRARWPDLPVMLFTASGSEELAVEALKEGVDDYITKTPRHYGRVPYAARACAERRQRQREAEEAVADLRRRESQLQLAMEAGAMTAWLIDAETGQLQIDRRLGGPMSALAGFDTVSRFVDNVHSDDRPRLEAAWRDALARSARLQVELRAVLAGEERWLEISAVPDDGSQAQRWVGVVRDITGAKRQELELRLADRAKDEFIGILAHELRNPLASIAYVGRLLEPGADERRIAHARAVIERQVGTTSRLLDDLLDASQLTRHQVTLRTRPVDLGEVVRDAVADVAEAAAGAGHGLDVSAPEQPLWIEGDRVRLDEIFANLLANAIKFTPSGGRIRVVVEGLPEEAIVAVEDNGVGIEAEMLEPIFHPYVQARRSPTDPHRGLGIGLAIVRRLVQAHGGAVHAQSAGAGMGTRFEVRLPRSEPPVAAADEAQRGAAPAAPALRVLVADDEPDIVETLRTILEIEGHDVVTALDGLSAQRAAEEMRPQVMVLDLGMPGMTGDAVARWVRARPWGGEVKLIAVSGWGRDEDRARTSEAGFDAHIVKPVGVDRLLGEITAGRGR